MRGDDGVEESYDLEKDWEAEEAMQAISEDLGEEPDDLASNCRASEDQEVYEAYVAMDKHRGARCCLRREVQKSRGFIYKAPNSDDRQALVNREKERSLCGATSLATGQENQFVPRAVEPTWAKAVRRARARATSGIDQIKM